MHYLSHLFIFLCAIAGHVLACSVEFKSALLASHNAKRALHQVGPLIMDEQLNIIAQDWANYLARINQLVHRPDTTVGEVIWYPTGGPAYQPNGTLMTEAAYDGQKYYNYIYPDMSLQEYWGGFTQMVWKGSQKLGVGCAASQTNYFIVANYAPSGNIVGSFRENVFPPRGIRSKTG